MENYTITSTKKFVRVIASGSVIPKEKRAYPALAVYCSPFSVYAAIIDYSNGKHYSVNVNYENSEELVDLQELNSDIEKVGAAIASIAKQAKIKKVKLSNFYLTLHEKAIIKSAVANGLQVI